jgi:hypothetical protein
MLPAASELTAARVRREAETAALDPQVTETRHALARLDVRVVRAAQERSRARREQRRELIVSIALLALAGMIVAAAFLACG